MGSSRQIGKREVGAGEPGAVVGQLRDIDEMGPELAYGDSDPAHVGSAAARLARHETAHDFFRECRF